MLSLLLLLLLCAFGFSVLRRLPISLYKAEILAAAIPVGFLLGSWLLLLLDWSLGFKVALPVSVILLLGGIVLLEKRGVKQLIVLSFSSRLWQLLSLTLVVVMAYLCNTHYLQVKNDGWYSVGNTWGDIALHLSLASYFVNQAHFSWDFSLFHGAKLTYPFLLDFLSAVFFQGGWNWHLSFAIPSFLLNISLIQLLFFLVYRVCKGAKAATAAVLMFLFGGSASGLWYFLQDSRSVGMAYILHDYTNLPDKGLHFTSILTAVLLPQRGIVLGIAIFLVVSLLSKLAYEKKDTAWPLLLLAGTLTGLLPFVHVHTFLVSIGLLGLLGLVKLCKKGVWLPWAAAVGIACLLAGPQLWWQLSNAYQSGFMHFYFGWMRAEHQSVFAFWLANFGLFLPLSLGIFFYRKKLGEWTVIFALLGIIVFVVANVVILQPNPYDNIKLIVYWYLIGSVGVAFLMEKWKWLLLALILICSPGLLALVYDTNQDALLVSNPGVAFAAEVSRATPENALILTSAQHNHPVNMLSGRRIVMGYTGWLWTYGIDYQPTAVDIQAIYSGSSSAEALIKKYGIQYVVISPEELSQQAINETFFEQHYKLVLNDNGQLLFAVR